MDGDVEELDQNGGVQRDQLNDQPANRLLLLAPDCPESRDLASFLLRNNFDVLAHNDAKAYTGIDLQAFDCVIVWAGFADDCLGVIKQLRSSQSLERLPILYIIPEDARRDCLDVLKAGANIEIRTPWDDAMLLVKLELLLKQRSALLALRNRLDAQEQVNAHLLADLDLGQQVQQSFLPPSQLRTENFALEARLYAGGDLSGDYFDYALLSQQRLVLFLADVSGHGIASALLANRLKAFFDENTRTAHRPRLFMERLNKVILDLGEHHHIATAICVHIDVEEGVLTYASAGHRTMYWLEQDDKYVELPTTGPALGMFKEFEINEINRGFMSGRNRLVTFTDGLVEFKMSDDKWITEEQFRDEIMLPNSGLRLEEYVSRLLESSRMMTGKRQWDDDVSLLTVDF